MPQPALPADDLYARLGVPTDASPEAIEVAWRALLRRHHPDVAGPDGLEQAKRINVAHDWLSDPALRARYDRERGLRHGIGPRGDGHRAWHARDGAGPAAARPVPPERRPVDQATRIARFLDRVAALTPTEIDRLALAEPPPIAFGATIRRFLPPEQRAALDEVEAAVGGRLPPGADRPTIRDAIDGYATELVLGPVPRRAPDRAVPRARPRAAHARLGRRRRPAALRPERRGRRGAASSASRGWTRPGSERLADTGADLRGTEDPWPAGRLARRRRRPPHLLDPRRRAMPRPRSRPGSPRPSGRGRGWRPDGWPTCWCCATPSRRRRSRR